MISVGVICPAPSSENAAGEALAEREVAEMVDEHTARVVGVDRIGRRIDDDGVGDSCDDPDDPAPGDEPVFDRGNPRVERFDAAGRDRDPQAFKTHQRPRSHTARHMQPDLPCIGIHHGTETRCLNPVGRNDDGVGVAGEHGR